MKYRHLIAMGLLIVTVGMFSMGTTGGVSGDLKSVYDKNDVLIECADDGIKVYNKSPYDIHGVTVKGTNDDLCNFTTETYIGTVKGNSITTKKLSSLKGFGFLNRVGGYSTVLLGLMVLLLVVEGISLYTNAKGGEYDISYAVVYAITALCIVIGLSVINTGIPDMNSQNYVEVKCDNYTVSFIENKIEIVSEKEKENIPFTVKYVLDDSKSANESAVILPGEKGSKLVTYDVTYVNGVVADKKLVSEKTLKEPEVRTISQGTKPITVSEKIPPVKLYKPDNTMNYGDYKLEKPSLEKGTSSEGEKEVTYKWDSQNQKVETSTVVLKEPGVEVWRAGTLLVDEEILPCKNKYIADEKHEVGYVNTVEDYFDGNRKTTYEVVIDELTGREKSGIERKKLSDEVIEPINGVVEVGVLAKNKTLKVEYTSKEKRNPSKYTTYKKVIQKGIDKKVKSTCIMAMDEGTGEVTDKVVKVLSEKVLVKGQDEIIEVGTKEPNWVKTTVLEDTIPYDTEYVASSSLKGSETKVKTEGKNGRVYSEYAMPCDDDGNLLLEEGYSEKVILEGAVEEPINRVIEVAPDSSLLK